MRKFENIIFDLGGVLLDIDYHLTRNAFEKLGVKQFDTMYSQAGANHLFQRLETGHIAEKEFYNELNRITGLKITDEKIRTAWNALLLSFREKSLDFLETIRHNYNLYLLSNTNFIHLHEFQKIFYQKKRMHPFEDYFIKAYYSCEIGLRKPDRECFEWVIEENNLTPLSTLFIDDSLSNIEAANSVGLQTVHLTEGMLIENLGL